MRRLITALLRMRPGRAAVAGLGISAAVITGGWGAAAAPAMASAAHPAAPAAKAAAASGGYVVQQVNPTTYTNKLSKTVPAIPLVQGNWIIKTRSGSAVREVTAEGLDITMQLHETGFSTFNKSRPSGATADIYTTPNGLCMHGTTTDLVIGSNNCGASNTSSQFYGDGNGRLECVCDGNYLGADSNSEGASVRLGPSTGLYYLTPFNIG